MAPRIAFPAARDPTHARDALLSASAVAAVAAQTDSSGNHIPQRASARVRQANERKASDAAAAADAAAADASRGRTRARASVRTRSPSKSPETSPERNTSSSDDDDDGDDDAEIARIRSVLGVAQRAEREAARQLAAAKDAAQAQAAAAAQAKVDASNDQAAEADAAAGMTFFECFETDRNTKNHVLSLLFLTLLISGWLIVTKHCTEDAISLKLTAECEDVYNSVMAWLPRWSSVMAWLPRWSSSSSAS